MIAAVRAMAGKEDVSSAFVVSVFFHTEKAGLALVVSGGRPLWAHKHQAFLLD